MSVSTLKLNTDGTLDTTGGRLHVLTGSEAIVQSVRSRLRLFRGEVYADLEKGFPWFEEVFVKGPNLTNIEEHVRATLLASPGITAVDYVTIELDGNTREATIRWRASTVDGDTVDDATEL